MFFGFLLPWLFGIYLIKRDKHTLLTIAPASVAIAFIFNEVAFYLGWWHLQPENLELLCALPFNLGMYPIMGAYMIHIAKRFSINGLLLITIVPLLLTCLEWIYVLFGRLAYGNGWNIGWTFVSYALGYTILYGYFRMLQKV
jgi:hypothetical protein